MNSTSQAVLIVGLGNPGLQYTLTRHNIGFLALDNIAKYHNFNDFSDNGKFSAQLAQGLINDHKIILAKPTTYMNLSGTAIQKIKHYYKIDNNNIIVIHDDIDLNFLQIKIKIGGSHAGHNGLKSIDNIIGKEYWRLRIGVGRPINNKIDVADYVLASFDKNEFIDMTYLLDKISSNFTYLLTDNRHKITEHL